MNIFSRFFGKKETSILFITEYFLPHWTGIVKAFYYLVKEIKSQGYNVTVLTTKFDKNLPGKEEIEGINVIRAPYLFKMSRTHYSPFILLNFLFLSHTADVIVINSPNSNILSLSFLSMCFDKKIIIYHQGDLTLPKSSGSQNMHFFMEKIFDLFTLPSMLISDIVSTDTEDYASHSRIMKHFMYKFHPFVPPVEFSGKEPDDAFRKKMINLKKNHKLIGFAGRFVEEKGFDILFRAIPHVIKEIPDALFLFAGKKKMDYEPFYEINKDLIEENEDYLNFLGLLKEPELAEFYRNLDLFVVSSRSDCFPVTQIEAAVSGVPIVVTDIPGARMLVKETGFGEITEPENPEKLSESIIKVIKNRENYMKYSVRVGTFLEKYRKFELEALL